jgi:hypothetical protein
MLGFPSGIFPLLMLSHLSRTTITSGRLRLEGVASGYWPPPAKRSSGLAATSRDISQRNRKRLSLLA